MQSTIDLGNEPLIATWLELVKAFEPLHLNIEADVSRLHDIYVNSMPAPSYRVAMPGKSFDERRPRAGDNLKVVMNPIELARWIVEVSTKHGFPYSQRQALNIVFGEADYGF